jgi:hypothetical protein
MKLLIHFLAFFFLGWPALIAGYLWACVTSGWTTGKHMHDRHEDAAIKRWVK